MHPRNINISEFDYSLPDERIARFPMPQRDYSKLLVYQKGKIQSSIFHQIGNYLDDNCLIISNNTCVIPARLFFKKKTGALIEIFCLEPENKSHQEAMDARGNANWWCMLGGAKKWKGAELLAIECIQNGLKFSVFAQKKKQDQEQFLITFQWPNEFTFSEILDLVGQLPLPPYFERDVEESDYERYQTIFAQFKGSVAAPTAGLHFTPHLIQNLRNKNVSFEEITLHVGAGTFRPVNVATMNDHNMHHEFFSVPTKLLIQLIEQFDKKIIAVGTTTMRTLESLYWMGAKILRSGKHTDHLDVAQWEPYQNDTEYSAKETLLALLDYANKNNLSRINSSTSILIAPGYSFKICNGLITNFHQPKSTLLLLVAAFIGSNPELSDKDWKRMYDYALNNEFRFLSYGDSCLLLP